MNTPLEDSPNPPRLKRVPRLHHPVRRNVSEFHSSIPRIPESPPQNRGFPEVFRPDMPFPVGRAAHHAGQQVNGLEAFQPYSVESALVSHSLCLSSFLNDNIKFLAVLPDFSSVRDNPQHIYRSQSQAICHREFRGGRAASEMPDSPSDKVRRSSPLEIR